MRLLGYVWDRQVRSVRSIPQLTSVLPATSAPPAGALSAGHVLFRQRSHSGDRAGTARRGGWWVVVVGAGAGGWVAICLQAAAIERDPTSPGLRLMKTL